MKKIFALSLSFMLLSIFPTFAQTNNGKAMSANHDNKLSASVQKVNENLTDHIDITKSPIPLSSRLNKVYQGYNYTLTNKYKDNIDIMNGTIINGINGQQGYLNVEKSSAAAIGSVLGGGFILGFVTLGVTFLAGIISTPFIYANNHSQNNKARNEGLSFSNQVPIGILSPGDSISFTTLVPIGQQPQLKMTLRNERTNEIFSISRQ